MSGPFFKKIRSRAEARTTEESIDRSPPLQEWHTCQHSSDALLKLTSINGRLRCYGNPLGKYISGWESEHPSDPWDRTLSGSPAEGRPVLA